MSCPAFPPPYLKTEPPCQKIQAPHPDIVALYKQIEPLYNTPQLVQMNHFLVSFLFDFLVVSEIILIFAPSNNSFMSYTKEPIIIDNPSKELLEVVKNLKERKRFQLEKLRNMKPEDFSCRIILK